MATFVLICTLLLPLMSTIAGLGIDFKELDCKLATNDNVFLACTGNNEQYDLTKASVMNHTDSLNAGFMHVQFNPLGNEPVSSPMVPNPSNFMFGPCPRPFRFFASEDRCKTFAATVQPTLMRSLAGQYRFIFQDPANGFTQSIHTELCAPKGYCIQFSFLSQRKECRPLFRIYNLLSWSPDDTVLQPVIDKFPVPDCCRCRPVEDDKEQSGSFLK